MPTTQLKIENLKKQMASAPPTASSSAPPAGGGSGAGENQEHTIFPWLVVGVGGAAAASAILTATSTTQGFLPPRMTGTQRDAIASPAAGLMVYNSTTNKLNFYNGSAWEVVTSA
jgi:hypothetical protein